METKQEWEARRDAVLFEIVNWDMENVREIEPQINAYCGLVRDVVTDANSDQPRGLDMPDPMLMPCPPEYSKRVQVLAARGILWACDVHGICMHGLGDSKFDSVGKLEQVDEEYRKRQARARGGYELPGR